MHALNDSIKACGHSSWVDCLHELVTGHVTVASESPAGGTKRCTGQEMAVRDGERCYTHLRLGVCSVMFVPCLLEGLLLHPNGWPLLLGGHACVDIGQEDSSHLMPEHSSRQQEQPEATEQHSCQATHNLHTWWHGQRGPWVHHEVCWSEAIKCAELLKRSFSIVAAWAKALIMKRA